MKISKVLWKNIYSEDLWDCNRDNWSKGELYHSTMPLKFAGNESTFPYVLRSHKSIISPEAAELKTVLLEDIKLNFQVPKNSPFCIKNDIFYQKRRILGQFWSLTTLECSISQNPAVYIWIYLNTVKLSLNNHMIMHDYITLLCHVSGTKVRINEKRKGEFAFLRHAYKDHDSRWG